MTDHFLENHLLGRAARAAGAEVIYWPAAAGPILPRGNGGGSLFLMEQGLARVVYRAKASLELTLCLVRPGELAGEAALFATEPGEVETRVMVTSRVHRVKTERWLRLCETDAEVAIWMARVSIRRQQEITARLASLTVDPSEERLARTLLELAGVLGKGGGRSVAIPLKQREMASLIGATRETTSDRLNRMAEQGLLRLRRGVIEVVDTEHLRRLQLNTARGAAVAVGGQPR